MFPLCAVRGLTSYPTGHSFGHQLIRFRKDNILVGRTPVDDNLVFLVLYQKNWEDPEAIRQSTLELVSDHPHEIREMIENTNMKSLSITHLRYCAPWDLLSGTFSKGTVMVAVDALHIMGPFLGQGGSAGLEDAVVLARIMAQLGSTSVGSGSKVTTTGVEKAYNQFVKQRRIRVLRLSLQTYLIGKLWGTSSHLKKILYYMLLSLLFHNQNSHTNYDCGCL
ncbi:putative FAD-binding domain, FAD/NAD(P)-binding domain superfamily [Helianthus debilis subsp. tardiflorus]